MLTSVNAVVGANAAEAPHTVSLLRHWRKQVALAAAWRNDPLFAGRLTVLRFEDVIADPQAVCGRIGAWLGLSEAVLPADDGALVDSATGARWFGNSYIESNRGGINRGAAGRWNGRLDAASQKLISYICGPEALLAGYDSLPAAATVDAEIVDAVLASGRAPSGWRSDSGDLLLDLGGEALRHIWLAGGGAPDEADLKRCFLSLDAAHAMRRCVSGRDGAVS
jgi:hypothetical protein